MPSSTSTAQGSQDDQAGVAQLLIHVQELLHNRMGVVPQAQAVAQGLCLLQQCLQEERGKLVLEGLA